MEISRESKHAIDPPLLRVAWNRNESIDHHLSFTVHATRTTNSYVSARSILEISGERWFFPSVRWKCRANALVVRANHNHHHHHPFSFSPLDDKWKMQLSLDERIHRRTLHPPLNRLICVYTRASLRIISLNSQIPASSANEEKRRASSIRRVWIIDRGCDPNDSGKYYSLIILGEKPRSEFFRRYNAT